MGLFHLPPDLVCGRVLPYLTLKDLSAFDMSVTARAQRRTLKSFLSACTLVGNHMKPLKSGALRWLAANNVRMEGICLADLTEEEIQHAQAIIQHARKLNFTHCVTHWNVTSAVRLLSTCKQLVVLLFGKVNVDATIAATLTQNCPNLRELWFVVTSGLDSSFLNSLVLPNLKILVLHNSAATAEFCRSFHQRCPNLTKLEVASTTVEDIDFTGMHALVEVRLALCKTLRDSALLSVAANCSSLEVLNLWGCQGISDAGVIEVARGCPKLRALDCYLCMALTDKTIDALRTHSLNLQTLQTEPCSAITDRALERLARHSKRRGVHLAIDEKSW